MKVTIDLDLTWDPPKKRDFHMTMGEATFNDKETGELVGWIRNVIPIGLDVHVGKTNRTYTIPLMSLFEAVKEGDEALDRTPGAADPEADQERGTKKRRTQP